MKSHRLIRRARSSAIPQVLSLTFLAVGLQSVQSQTVFEDTFNYGGVPVATNDLTLNIAARQAGGATTSTYTKSIIGAGVNDALLNTSNGEEVLLLRTFNQPGASQTRIDLDTNFASDLSGKSYSIILDDVWFARSAADISDAWLGLSIGDDGGGVNGPNSPIADIGLLIRPRETGNNVWRDNSPTTGSGLNWGFANRYEQIQLDVDEVGGTVSGQITTANGTYAIPTLPFSFDNSTNRFFELKGHQGGVGTDGQLMDTRIGNMQIVIVPEPGSLALMALGNSSWTRSTAGILGGLTIPRSPGQPPAVTSKMPTIKRFFMAK